MGENFFDRSRKVLRDKLLRTAQLALYIFLLAGNGRSFPVKIRGKGRERDLLTPKSEREICRKGCALPGRGDGGKSRRSVPMISGEKRTETSTKTRRRNPFARHALHFASSLSVRIIL